MGRPREYKDNAARQAAYRARLKAAEVRPPATLNARVAAAVKAVAPDVNTDALRGS